MALKGVLTGIAAIKAAAGEKQKKTDGDGAFTKLGDGESMAIRFLQEMDESGKHYDDRRGTIVVVHEHSDPKNYKKKIVCTMESENRCYGCQQASGGSDTAKSWKPRLRFYANVIVRGVDGADDKVKVLAQGFGGKAIGNTLIEFAGEYGSLLDSDYKVTRSGADKDNTEYTIIPKAPKVMTKADLAHEVIDLSKFVNYLAYDEQEAYFANSESEKKNW